MRAAAIWSTALLIDLALVGYGLIRTPAALTTNPNGMIALVTLVAAYALYAMAMRRGPMRARQSPALRIATTCGTGLGIVLGAVAAAEYFVPMSYTARIIVGSALAVTMVAVVAAATVTAYRRTRAPIDAMTAAGWTAVITYTIWFGCALGSFYLWGEGNRLHRMLSTEGTMRDFGRSGMTDLRAFLMQDYLADGFFRLVFGTGVALVVSLVVIGVMALAKPARVS